MLRLFGASSVLALVIAVTACGDDDPADPALSTCATIGPLVEIVDNHLPTGGDHEMIVTAADVVAAIEKVYDIRGDNVGHTHTVTLISTNFLSLQSGDPVSVVSSNNGPVGLGHVHPINLTCP